MGHLVSFGVFIYDFGFFSTFSVEPFSRTSTIHCKISNTTRKEFKTIVPCCTYLGLYLALFDWILQRCLSQLVGVCL